jgi:hypothetical protein
MNWNKCFGYLIVINIIALLFSYAMDRPIDGWPIFIALIIANVAFGFFCRGWQRFFAIMLVIVSGVVFITAFERQETLSVRLDRIQRAAEDYAKTNSQVVTPLTNSVAADKDKSQIKK